MASDEAAAERAALDDVERAQGGGAIGQGRQVRASRCDGIDAAYLEIVSEGVKLARTRQQGWLQHRGQGRLDSLMKGMETAE